MQAVSAMRFGKGSGEAAKPWVMAERSPQVISLSLNNPEEMFVLASVDLFSEYRNFMTGLEYCISVLRGRPSSRPVQIDLALPACLGSGSRFVKEVLMSGPGEGP
jgi:hypothetical protein